MHRLIFALGSLGLVMDSLGIRRFHLVKALRVLRAGVTWSKP